MMFKKKINKKVKFTFFLKIMTIFSFGFKLQSQDLCPPAFISGIPADGTIQLNWEEPDSLGGLGEEIFTACFPVCPTASEGFTIEHLGQDTSGGWFQNSDGEVVECGEDMYPCSDGSSDGFGAIAIYSDSLAPVNSRLSMGTIDLTNFTTAWLVFEEYYLYSDFSNDSNWVEISTNGVDWTPVIYSDPITYGDGYVINGVDISNYAGQSVYIGFRFFDSIGYNENWQIDNIRVFGGNGVFENPCGTLTGYNIYSNGTFIGFSEINSYTISGLTNNIEYCYTVTAVYSEGESAESIEACFAPVDPFELTRSSFRDTLDFNANEYSLFEFLLVNSDTANHDFNFDSELIVEANSENTLMFDDFNTGQSTNFFDPEGYWSIGTVDSANGTYLSYPMDSDGHFYYWNDGSDPYYYNYASTSPILQSQAIPYDGTGPVFFFLDMYFPQPYDDCSSGSNYSENAFIVVSTDNGANWTIVDSTFRTAVNWSGYYAYENTEANWHSLMYNITNYIVPGIFNVGIHYDDCGGNWSSGIGVDNIKVIQGDETNWLSWERLSGEIISGDSMTMSLTMMPLENMNQYEESMLYLSEGTMSQLIDIYMITDVENIKIDYEGIPNQYTLYQNYPNPFNPETILNYNLPKDQMVNITIYDIMGRKIKDLVNNHETAGSKSIMWDATNNSGSVVSGGVYFYSIKTGEFNQTKKMIFLK